MKNHILIPHAANGTSALYSNTTGTFNTSLGCNSDVSTGALTNATADGVASPTFLSNT